MLDDCAPGYTKKAREHNWLVTYGKVSYPSLPRGGHGRRENPSIQIGHVRNMVRQFGIQDCLPVRAARPTIPLPVSSRVAVPIRRGRELAENRDLNGCDVGGIEIGDRGAI